MNTNSQAARMTIEQMNEFIEHASQAQSSGQSKQAIEILSSSGVLAAKHPVALNIAAVCSRELQLWDQAERFWLDAVGMVPNYIEGYTNLGNFYIEQERFDEAERMHQKALSFAPKSELLHKNLGILYKRWERYDRAEQVYQHILKLNPDNVNAHQNLGLVYNRLRRYEEAELHYVRALAWEPENNLIRINLANVYLSSKQFEPALAQYELVCAQDPENVGAAAWLHFFRAMQCDWSDRARLEATVIERCREDETQAPVPFMTLTLEHALPEDLLLINRAFAQREWVKYLGKPARKHPIRDDVGFIDDSDAGSRRLHIGYLSPDFGNHPVSHLVVDVLRAHDARRFKVTLLDCFVRSGSPMREQLQAMAEQYVVLDGMSDAQAADLIEQLQVDVLVDLAGHTSYSRSGINILRPAPITVQWLGYIGTLGEPRLADYIIGDAIATPMTHAQYFSEAIVQLPDGFQPNRAYEPPAVTQAMRAQYGLPAEAVVLCSFNQAFKLNPEVWDDWCAILRRVPNAVLWLSPHNANAQENLRVEAKARGVAPERLIFAEQLPLKEHHARIGLADLALDTYPYGSGTTGSDALRAGVPMITRMGATFVSRMAASLLQTLNLNHLITHNRADYVTLACSLAGHPEALLKLKGQLAAILPHAALFQPERFSRHLEDAYETMWRRHQQGLPPEGFAVKARE